MIVRNTWLSVLLLCACDPASVNKDKVENLAVPASPVVAKVEAKIAGPEAKGESYHVVLQAEEEYDLGKQTFAIALKPRGEWHVNKEYPISLSIKPTSRTASFLLPKREMGPADATKVADEEATFEVPFEAKNPGEYAAEALLSFAMCTPKTCVQEEAMVLAMLKVGNEEGDVLE